MLITATFEVPNEEFEEWLKVQESVDGDHTIDGLTGQLFLDECFAVLYTDASSYNSDWLNFG